MYILLFTNLVFGWALRGHDTICQVATGLVDHPQAKVFYQSQSPAIGYLCNTPDTVWKSNGKDLSKEISKEEIAIGSTAHYMDIEDFGVKEVSQIPIDFKDLKQKFPNLNFQDSGSAWWRTEQFFKLATTNIIEVIPPKEANPKGVPPIVDDKAVQFLTNIGILGHFVGDLSMPLHSSSDYDGWKSGHGGLHGYYEEKVVAALPGNLNYLVYTKALELKKRDKKKYKSLQDLQMALKDLTEFGHAQIPKMYKLDKVLKESRVEKQDTGIEFRFPAERELPSVAAPRFKKMIVEQLARSALLYSHYLEVAYTQSIKGDLSYYRWYVFPHKPAFVYPEYIKEFSAK